MHALGVIPARFQSSRFPGKPLALIQGKTLVQRVHERARGARRLSHLVVATDDARIARAVEAFGGEAVMTSPEHPSGTDRLAEVARRLPADLYVNVQGDEPLLDPGDVDRLVECLDADPGAEMATLAQPMDDECAAQDANVVKVVCDGAGRALYFSRSAIPFVRHPAAGGEDAPPAHDTPGGSGGTRGDSGLSGSGRWLRHVGLYAYRARFLTEFASWPAGRLESIEGLEQLRALEAGRTIRVVAARGRYVSVDTPEDVIEVENALQARS